ncbi:MAG: hypothetical protein A2Y91_07400 [Chloroflexi bacterium RBG_13_54_8]|nr:MAG: hypothetical protein A2Y91_07400 [Chloroflexi bacterium RBG_13_54_8]
MRRYSGGVRPMVVKLFGHMIAGQRGQRCSVAPRSELGQSLSANHVIGDQIPLSEPILRLLSKRTQDSVLYGALGHIRGQTGGFRA